MLKNNRTLAGAGLVLIFGLMSCAPKQIVKRDTFIAPAPKIIMNSGSQDVKTWDPAEKKDLDLHDAIDITEARAAGSDVTTVCRVNDRQYSRVSQPIPTTPIKILQVLPFELLTMDVNASSVSCTFEVSIRNSVGSRHIFNLGSAIIHDAPSVESPLTLSQDNKNVVREQSYWRTNNLADLKFRRRDENLSRTISVICEGGRTRPMTIDSVLNMADFDFEKIQANLGQEKNVFQVQPLQLCRGVILRGENAEAITSLFDLHFPDSPLQVVAQKQLYRSPVQNAPLLKDVSRGNPLPLDTYQITNPDPSDRILMILKHPRIVHVHAVFHALFHNALNYHQGGARLTCLKLDVKAGPSTKITETSDHWRVELGPQQTLLLNTTFHTGGVRTVATLTGLALEFLQNIDIIEVTKKDREISRVTLNLGPRAVIANMRNPNDLLTMPLSKNEIPGW